MNTKLLSILVLSCIASLLGDAIWQSRRAAALSWRVSSLEASLLPRDGDVGRTVPISARDTAAFNAGDTVTITATPGPGYGSTAWGVPKNVSLAYVAPHDRYAWLEVLMLVVGGISAAGVLVALVLSWHPANAARLSAAKF